MSDSLRVEIPTICTEAQATLDDDRLSDEIKRLRIGNIHNRLTQTLLLHIGVIIVEVCLIMETSDCRD